MNHQPSSPPALPTRRPAIIQAAVWSALAALALGPVARAQTQPPAAAPIASDVVNLSTFTVSDTTDRGYQSLETTSGTRTVEKLANVPSSISVVNGQLINDLGGLSIEELSKWFVTGEDNPDPSVSNRLIFRGIVNNYQMRDGWIWYSPVDSFSVDRIELVRGPNAFLYGEADVGGTSNVVTKQAEFGHDFTAFKLQTGSDSLVRATVDINRQVTDKVALRVNAVYSNSNAWYDYGKHLFIGQNVAVKYRPFQHTVITISGENGERNQVYQAPLYLDRFSAAATSKYSKTNSGLVYVPATGELFKNINQLFATGPGVIDPDIIPRTALYKGPGSTKFEKYQTVSFNIEQDLTANLHLLFSGNFYHDSIKDNEVAGLFANGVTRDLNPKLPNGQVNPNYGQLYTEYYRTAQNSGNTVRDLRLSLVYQLNLSWMKQQLVFNAQQHQDNPGQGLPKMAEFIDPSNPNFTGTLNQAPTLAAYQANRTLMGGNIFYRRFYLNGGDAANLVANTNAIPGVSTYLPDYTASAFSTNGVDGYNRRFYTPSVGFGASGTYWGGRVHTLLGVRHDEFVLGSVYGLPAPLANQWVVNFDPANDQPRYQHFKLTAYTAGGVFDLTKWMSLTGNYSQSYRLSLGLGKNGYLNGTDQGLPVGRGTEFGVRFHFLNDRLEVNTTYFRDSQPNSRINPLTSTYQNVITELNTLFPTQFNSAGGDTQNLVTSGFEAELIANPVDNWHVIFNLATDQETTSNRLPQLKYFQALGKTDNLATPNLDAFLPLYPDGLPTGGYTRLRANVFTRYDFTAGFLKGAYIGGGANLRERTFMGPAVINGVSMNLWAPAYAVYSALVGYRTRLLGHPTTFALNVDNVFNTIYWRAAATTVGSWGEPRSFKLSASVDF